MSYNAELEIQEGKEIVWYLSIFILEFDLRIARGRVSCKSVVRSLQSYKVYDAVSKVKHFQWYLWLLILNIFFSMVGNIEWQEYFLTQDWEIGLSIRF